MKYGLSLPCPAKSISWWRHQTETFSALLALCKGNSPATGEFPSQRPVACSYDVFFDLRLNKRLNTPSRRRWFETPSRSLWHNVMWNYWSRCMILFMTQWHNTLFYEVWNAWNYSGKLDICFHSYRLPSYTYHLPIHVDEGVSMQQHGITPEIARIAIMWINCAYWDRQLIDIWHVQKWYPKISNPEMSKLTAVSIYWI